MGIIAAVSSLAVASVIGFTIWGVKKHSSKKSDELNQNKGDNKKIISKEDIKEDNNKSINLSENASELNENKPIDIELNKVSFEEEVVNKISQYSEKMMKQYNEGVKSNQENGYPPPDKPTSQNILVNKFKNMIGVIKGHNFSEEEESKLEILLKIVRDDKITKSYDFYGTPADVVYVNNMSESLVSICLYFDKDLNYSFILDIFSDRFEIIKLKNSKQVLELKLDYAN